MPTVPIVRLAHGRSRPNTMGVKVENKPVVSLVTTPITITGTPGVWSINKTERPGRQPITSPAAPGLRTVAFEHTVSSMNPYHSIEHLIHPFRALAETGKRVQFIGGGMLPTGTWFWILSLEFSEVMKARDNRTSRMNLKWKCEEANLVSSVALSKTGVKPGTVTRIPAGASRGTFIPGTGGTRVIRA